MMKAHNRALDFVTLALSQGRKGNIERSAALLQAALEEPDCVTAIRILEASNKQALLQQTQARAAAAKPAAKAATAKPTQAKKAPVKAEFGDDDEIDDGLDDESMDALMDGGDEDGDAVEEEGDEEGIVAGADDEEDEEDDGEEVDDAAFAKLLAAMRKQAAKPAKK